MRLSSYSLKETLLMLGIGAFLAMSFFGIFHSANSMSMDGKMSDCPYMPGMALCPMTPLEHAGYMQSFFSNIPIEKNATETLLSFIGFAIFVGFAYRLSIRSLFTPPRPKVSEYIRSFFIQEKVLQNLFSQGILNPKPY